MQVDDVKLKKDGERRVTFLPEPEPRELKYMVIWIADHLVEPPHVFEARVPEKFADLAPKVVEQPDGSQCWIWNGKKFLLDVGLNAAVGRHLSAPDRSVPVAVARRPREGGRGDSASYHGSWKSLNHCRRARSGASKNSNCASGESPKARGTPWRQVTW